MELLMIFLRLKAKIIQFKAKKTLPESQQGHFCIMKNGITLPFLFSNTLPLTIFSI